MSLKMSLLLEDCPVGTTAFMYYRYIERASERERERERERESIRTLHNFGATGPDVQQVPTMSDCQLKNSFTVDFVCVLARSEDCPSRARNGSVRSGRSLLTL